MDGWNGDQFKSVIARVCASRKYSTALDDCVGWEGRLMLVNRITDVSLPSICEASIEELRPTEFVGEKGDMDRAMSICRLA